MRGWTTYSMRIAILALYCIYTISPIYLSAMTGRQEFLAECGDPARNVTVGIVWVRVLLSSFCSGEQEAASVALREVKAHDQERDFILIRKKRAVRPLSPRVKPRLEKLADVPVPSLSPVLASRSQEAPCQRSFRQENLALFMHAGLSPPSHSS